MVNKLNLIMCHIENNDNAIVLHAKKNYRINIYNELPAVYILKVGKISVLSRYDNLCHFEFSSPSIIGLSQVYKKNTHHYFRCETECTFIVLNADIMRKVLNANALWDIAFELLVENLELTLNRTALIEQKSALIIINSLEDLWTNSQEKDNHSFYSFIMKKNAISRSTIYKVVRELQSEGVVTVKHGKLCDLDINKLMVVKSKYS